MHWSDSARRALLGFGLGLIGSLVAVACAAVRFPVQMDLSPSIARPPELIGGDGPRPLLRDQAVELRFSQPLEGAVVELPLAVDAQVDTSDPRVLRLLVEDPEPGQEYSLRLVVEDPEPGQEYSLRLVDVIGQNGAKGEEHRLALRTPNPALLLSVNGFGLDGPIIIQDGEPVVLGWAEPVTSLRYQLGRDEGIWTGAPTELVSLVLPLLPGRTLDLTLIDATTTGGGWLRAEEKLAIYTPGIVRLASIWPVDGSGGIDPGLPVYFRFSEPIVDRAALEAAISFESETPGGFEWLAPDRVRFVPDDQFPSNTPVTVHVRAQDPQLMGRTAGFILEPTAVSFVTGGLRVIDVSLSEQRLTLYEDDQVVWTTRVATGVKGAETPPGVYRVQYKMPRARFRGVNPSGLRYDIPDVKWVMAFYQDYTIHGAYWRSAFGRPGSNGCVSMTDADAKRVYDWADDGTRVIIRA
jgi:lipoprotein-anchoring transpeptidase ErfK/SrfK